MLKWVVLGHNVFAKRFELLSHFLSENGIQNQFKIHSYSTLEFPEKLKETLKEWDQIRIESPFGEMVLSEFHKKSLVSDSLGAVDVLVQRQGEWWPEASLLVAFSQLFSKYGQALDLSAEILIVGAGASARMAVVAALRAGYSHINITSKFDDQGLQLMTELRQRYFGVTFEFIPQNKLVLLPGMNTLVINTTPFSSTNDLLEELYYLNFLRPDGMIWDLTLSPSPTPLIKEGEQNHIKCVYGYEVAYLMDLFWIRQVVPLTTLNWLELESLYRTSLSVIEFAKADFKNEDSEKSDLGLVTKNVTTG